MKANSYQYIGCETGVDKQTPEEKANSYQYIGCETGVDKQTPEELEASFKSEAEAIVNASHEKENQK